MSLLTSWLLIKGLGHVPKEHMWACAHVHLPTQNYLQPAQSNIFYYRTFYSLLVSLHLSFYCPGVFLVYVESHKNHKICDGNLICKIIFKTLTDDIHMLTFDNMAYFSRTFIQKTIYHNTLQASGCN